MLNRDSIFLKLNVLFLLAAFSITFASYVVYNKIYDQQYGYALSQIIASDRIILESYMLDPALHQETLTVAGMKIVKASPELFGSLTPFPIASGYILPKELQARLTSGNLQLYWDDSSLYFYLLGPKEGTLIAKPFKKESMLWLLVMYILLMLLILVVYIALRKSLLPLKELALQIRMFGEGKTILPPKTKHNDEISFVAEEFHITANKIKAITEARSLFLRNVMHELKTPITKGKLSLAMLEPSEETEILDKAFKRMEQLAYEMSKIERIQSRTWEPDKQPCSIPKLIQKSCDLLFLEDEALALRLYSKQLYADHSMMIITFKNLIDNAIKYSSNDHAAVVSHKDRIDFINRGEPVSMPIDKLLQPFVKGNSSKSSYESLGLGLYIISSILEAHGFGFRHRYKMGFHIFSIVLPPPKPHIH